VLVSPMQRHAVATTRLLVYTGGLSEVLTRNVMDTTRGEVWQFTGNALHVVTIHVIVDATHIAHVGRHTLQLLVAAQTMQQLRQQQADTKVMS